MQGEGDSVWSAGGDSLGVGDSWWVGVFGDSLISMSGALTECLLCVIPAF